MASNTEKGNALRDIVFRLAKAAQKQNCEIEKNLGAKNVDVYYEEKSPIKKGVLKIAIECKDLGHTLNKTDFGEIWNDYSSAKSSDPSAFDYLIIITTNSVTAPIQERINGIAWIEHYTIDEYRSSLMDFSDYLYGLEAEFKQEGLDQYYIQPKDISNNDLEQEIDNWISSQNAKPKAILAGYGMGKSSFAKRIASKYANHQIRNSSGRIPILIKLGDISKEQGLEGLICKYFSSDYTVSGFNYPLFMEFNRLGCFIILLDGFDEMKHAMDFSDFQKNIKEFNKLVEKESKVLLFGRPNAFMSDDEKNSVLHGYRKIDDKEIKYAGMVDYDEIKMAGFTISQISEFVKRFLAYEIEKQKSISDRNLPDNLIEQRVNELSNPDLEELISRPVHAQMLSYIALSTEDPIVSYTRFGLYQHFIDTFFERESEKNARSKISKSKRKEFIRNVAWYFWINGGRNYFHTGEIPEKLYKNHVDDSIAGNDAILRELVIGNVIERKDGDRLFFAHRSFQEYLVSEYILFKDYIHSDIPEIATAINTEISTFIEESRQLKKVSENILPTLCSFKGALHINLLELLSKSIEEENITELLNHYDYNPWVISIIFLSTFNMREHEKLKSITIEILTQSYFNSDDDISKVACLILLAIANKRNKFNDSNRIPKFILSRIIEENITYLDKINKSTQRNSSFAIDGRNNTLFMKVLCDCTKGIINEKAGFSICLDLQSLANTIDEVLYTSFSIEGIPDYNFPRDNFFRIDGLKFTINKKLRNFDISKNDEKSRQEYRLLKEEQAKKQANYKEIVKKFYNKHQDPKKMVTVTKKDNTKVKSKKTLTLKN